MTKAARIIGVLFILFSMLPLGICAYCYMSTSSFLNKAENTHGTVLEVVERRTSDGTMYYPVYSFVDVYGTKHKIYSKSGSYPPQYDVGDTISILYDPENPKEIKMDSFLSLWMGTIVAGVLGIIPFLIGAVFFFVVPIIINRVLPDTGAQAPTEHPPAQQGELQSDDRDSRMWSMFCHLTALSAFIGIPFGNIIGPLIIWLIKKDDFPMVNDQGKESLNFQISMTIYTIVSFFLCFVIIGFLLLPAVLLVDLILVIIASVEANKGDMYRYPFTIRLIR
jgi:uncharacterized Tic20 family protein